MTVMSRSEFHIAFGDMIRTASPDYTTNDFGINIMFPHTGEWDGVVTDHIRWNLSQWYRNSLNQFKREMHPDTLRLVLAILDVAKYYAIDHEIFVGLTEDYQLKTSDIFDADTDPELIDAVMLERICYYRDRADITPLCELALRIMPHLSDDIVAIRLGTDSQPYFTSLIRITKQ